MKYFLFSTFVCLLSQTIFAQPVNDNACDATLLTVGATCSGTPYTTAQANGQSGEQTACGSQTNSVWFKFTAPASGAVRIISSGASVRKSLYSVGDCSNFNTFTWLDCTRFGSDIWHSGLTAGTVYWIRVTSTSSTATFCMSVQDVPSRPANDAVCSATLIELDSACSGNIYTNVNATRQTGEPTSCSNEGQTVWFKFTAPPSGAVLVSMNNESLATSIYAVTDSCDDFNSFTELTCLWFGDALEASGLTPDSTYYIQSTSLFDEVGAFCLTVETVLPPTNDSAYAAILLNVDGECNDAPYSLTGATYEVGEPDSCFSSPFTAWFKFVVPSGGAVEVDVWSSSFWSVANVLTADDSGDFSTYATIGCAGYNGPSQLFGLTAGDTVFIQINSYDGYTGGYCVAVDTLFQWFADFDGDGYGDPNNVFWASYLPYGYAADSTDCNDNSASIYPDATEICDGYDNNCDGQIDEGVGSYFFADMDGDGFGNAALDTLMCSAIIGFVADSTDCNDSNSTIFPNAPELCDGLDNDCDGQTDEDTPTWYADLDGDGFGNANLDTLACDPGTGWVLDSTDCDDAHAAAHPGAAEICDNLDNDCNGQTDEGLLQTFYADADGDGFGNPAADSTTCATSLTGYVSNSTDCNDANASAHPGGTEICDLVDNDCDGTIDEGFDVFTYYADADGDGFGNPASTILACTSPPGYVYLALDCDDTNPAIHYGAAEICDGLDNDCDGQIDEGALLYFYLDADGDGYGEGFGYSQNFVMACSQPAGYAPVYGDCDDSNPAIHPGAMEICNGLDDDCDGGTDEGAGQFFYLDNDGDGYGNGNIWQFACAAPSGYVADGNDCNDTNPNIHPGKPETCDGIDQNCNGQTDEGVMLSVYQDSDGDGYGGSIFGGVFCSVPTGWAANNDDCDDGNANIHPGATEICENGIDENCDGSDDECTSSSVNDLGVTSILSPNANALFALGSQPVQVVIRNFGMDVVETATIKWQVNGVPQTDFAYSGSGLSQNERDTIVIGTAVFGLGANTISAETFNPDGMADPVPANNETEVSNLYAALNGTYTIGGGMPDFWDFSATANQLNLGGVVGPVTMNIRNGTYEEQLVLEEIPGSSSANTLLFQSESGDSSAVILRWGDGSPLILDGTDYATFKQISIEGNSSSNDVVTLQNGANHVEISNCDLVLDFYNSTGAVVNNDNATLDSFLIVRNCRLENGLHGVYAQAPLFQKESGVVIENNEVVNTKGHGIFLAEQGEVSVIGNRVQINQTGYTGIYLFGCSAGSEVSKNKINVPSGSGLNASNLFGSAANPVLIANNFIVVGEGYTGNNPLRGVELYFGSHVHFYHNNVRVSGTNSDNRAFYNHFGTDKKFFNNVLANVGTGGFAIYNQSTGSNSQSNHNDLLSSGQNLGHWNGLTAATLANWQTATGQDLNSISEDPLFLSPLDLHVQNIYLDGAGLAVSEVSDDIDGETRNATTPDIGADEFAVSPNNAGMVAILAPQSGCGLGAQNVTIRMRNYTAGPLTGFDVSYQLSGGATVTENVGGLVLPAHSTADYTFAQTANFANSGSFDLTAWTAVAGDGFAGNDTLARTVHNGDVIGTLDNFVPADGTTDVEPTPYSGYLFSWGEVSGATAFDFYLWADGDPEPTTPTYANQPAISIYYNFGNLNYGGTYHWRVVAKNAFCSVPGPVLTFSAAQLSDLVVTNITVPLTMFSGQNAEISWEVKNVGGAETGLGNFWFDDIYLSDDTILNPLVDIYLGYKQNFTALLPQQSYINTGSYYIPSAVSGDFYILVRTNSGPMQTELDYSNNTGHSTALLDVVLTDYSDLVVAAANAPANSFGGQNFQISWTVKNVGPGQTDKSIWVDRVFLTPDTLDMSGAVQIASRTRGGILEPDSSYTVTMTTTNVPLSAYDAYFLVFRTDVLNNVWEFVYETNNRLVLPITMLLTPPPDLYVTEIDLPDTIHYGQVLSYGHSMTNQGTGPTHKSCENTLHLSTQPDTSINTFTSLGSVAFNILPQNQTESKVKNVQIPFYLQPGDYYGYVRADPGNDIFEYDKEDNNISRTGAIKLIAPDLVVSNLQVPANASNGELITVTWTVKNNSFGGIYHAPTKAIIYFSNSSSPGSLNSAVQYPFNLTLNLAPHDSLTREMQFAVPCALTTGDYYVFVKEDALNQVIETDNLNNLSNPPAPIAVQYADCAAPDYAITTMTTPAVTMPCLKVTVDYTVKNLSTTTPGYMLCEDYIYLSTDTILNFGDEVLDKIPRSLNLQPLAEMELTATVRIPELPLAGGTYYLLVSVGEHCSSLQPFLDSNPDNNLKPSISLVIPAIESPDLIVNTSSVPGIGQSGQSIHVEYTVKNNGAGSTNVARWVDKIYLSATPYVNPLGQGPNQWPLATITRTSALGGGLSYTHIGDFNIPLSIPTGNYFVVIISDFNDNVCEWDNDGNNQKSEYIFIQQPPPADLVVTSIMNEDTVMAGSSTLVSWTVRNNGEHSAIGGLKQVVYLSEDPNWDIDDVVVGSLVSGVELNPGQSGDYALTLPVTGAGVGNYYVLVRTDALDQILESDNVNNISSGGDLLTVTVNELVLDVPMPDLLMPNVPLYYRIEIPAGLAGETMVVSLTTPDSVAASNQLYLRFGNVPSAGEFDFTFNNPVFGNQESVVPVLQAGTYYLMAVGNKMGGGPQNIELLARLQPFEIRSVQSDKGGNTGFTTVQIGGAKFTPDMVVSLLGDTTIVADTLYYISPVNVFARFNLNGMPIGSYHMQALKLGLDTTLRENAFEVVEGAPNNLLVEFIHPFQISIRSNRAAAEGPFARAHMIAQYKNAGLNDIPIPEIPVQSIGGAPISLSSNDLATTGGSLQVLVRCTENNGPPDVLRAGAEGSVIIYMIVSDAPLFVAKF